MKEWAGERAFDRGSQYFFEGRVQVERKPDGSVAGEAHGSEVYGLWLKHAEGEWRWHCDCPAADGGAFCKHLIAAVMAAANDAVRNAPDGEAVAKKRQPVTAKPDELLAFLRAQPAERLAGWLHELAQDDRDVEKRLQLYRAAEQPAALKTALGKLINTGGFLDYRRAIRYAQRLDAGIDQLRGVLARDPAECRALCEYALKRLFKVYDGNADDSAGAIGDRLHEIAALHAQACEATPPGKALAKPLHDLKCVDGWDLLPLAHYWQALGPDGQADYGKRVMAGYERLPPASPQNRYGASFGAVHRTEELARCTRDFELLQRVLRRDLTHEWDYLRVLESLREFGREREALAWAEAALKKFPDDTRLRVGLADCLAEAGMHDEALEQRWECFARHPCDDYWDGLKRVSGKEWPAWRARALAHVAAHEKGVVSKRIELLLHDGDLKAAVQLARANQVAIERLLDLADAVKRSEPAAAGAFYLRAAQAQTERLNGARDYQRLVKYLVSAAKLLPAAALFPLVSSVREQHRHKPKLMGMLDKAGF